MFSAFQHPYAEANISRIRTTQCCSCPSSYDNEQFAENLQDASPRVKITGPSLRGQPAGSPGQKGRFTNRRKAEQHHEHPCKPEPEATVGWTAEFEEVEIESDVFRSQSALYRLRLQPVQTMLPLRACCDFESFPKEVEALGQAGFILHSHMVERSDVHRIVDDEHELVAKFFLNVFAEDALSCGVEIAVALVPVA
jgi:hypothetical protein